MSNSIQYADNLNLLEPFCKLHITYRRSVFLFHLARAYYQYSLDLSFLKSFFISRVGQGRNSYAYKLIQQALQTVSDAYHEVGTSSAVLELKIRILRLKQSLLTSYLNTNDSEELQKQQRFTNQQRLFLDPTNILLWYFFLLDSENRSDYLSDESVLLQSNSPNFIIDTNIKPPESSSTLSLRHSVYTLSFRH